MRAEDEWMGKPGLCATVRVLRMAFFRKVITRHDTGLGEAYMDGDFLVSHQHAGSPQKCSIRQWLHGGCGEE